MGGKFIYRYFEEFNPHGYICQTTERHYSYNMHYGKKRTQFLVIMKCNIYHTSIMKIF